MRSKYMYSLTRAMLNLAICDVGGARLMHLMRIKLTNVDHYIVVIERENINAYS